jgi:hypothetical protein
MPVSLLIEHVQLPTASRIGKHFAVSLQYFRAQHTNSLQPAFSEVHNTYTTDICREQFPRSILHAGSLARHLYSDAPSVLGPADYHERAEKRVGAGVCQR